MKKFYFLLSLLMSLTISTVQLWADETTFNYSDYKGKGTSSSGSEYTMADKDDVSIGDTKFYGNNSYAHFYANGVTTITPSSGVTITKIVLTASGTGYTGYQSSGTMTWSAGSSSVNNTTVTWTGSASSAFTLSHNKQIRWTSIVVTYTKESGVTPTCATPTFSPEAGSYEGTQNVTISSTAGATIYYTTDGSTPSTSSSVYSNPIAVSADMTIKAYAVKSKYNDSEVAEAAYIITEGPDVLLDFTTNTDWEFPAGSSNKTVDEGSYSDGTYTIKVAGSTGEGYYHHSSGYLFLGKTGAYIELPQFASPVERIVVVGTSGGSESVKFNVFDGATAVSTEVSGCKNVEQQFTITNLGSNKVYTIKVTSNANLQVSKIKVFFGEAPAVETPSISGEENFVTSANVTLACGTDGASIYYTTDGTIPTSSSTAYSAPFTLNATSTVKAIAIKGGASSEVATKSFTKVTPLTTMDAIYSKASENSGAEKDAFVTFNNWIVSGAKGNTAYVTDGTKGFIVYYSGHGFTEGDILSGTGSFKLKLYNGAAEITAKNSGTITITKGGTATLNELDAAGIEALSGINTGSLIKVSGECSHQTINSKDYYYIAGVQLFTTLFTYTNPTAGNNYNCTGVYVQYNSTKEIMPRSAADIEIIEDEDAPESPTFSPAAGIYTSVQNVEISCATEGTTIYYTTGNSTPTDASTPYTEAIRVGETTTINAIAIKNGISSSIASATFTINLPEDESTSKTWDLSVVSCDDNPTDELMQWTGTYVTMAIAKGTGTKVTNYYPGTSGKTYTSTRFYQNNKLTITPDGKKLTSILFQATSDSYATALINSTWTNATAALLDASTPKIVKVTPTKSGAISAVIGATCGFTQVRIEYQDVPNIPVSGISLDQTSVTLKEGKSIELTATIAPEDAANQNVTWTSSNETVATVANGVVTAGAIGKATITCTSVADPTIKATCVVTVIDASTRVEPLAAFQKVTATGDITDGDYLIVYEEDGAYFAFDGGLETLDGAHNNIEVAIEDGYIKAPSDAIFTIDVTNGTIKSYSGAYIGVSSNSNGLKQSSSADTYTNSFSISEGNVVISAVFENSTMSLRFNYGANDKRFRYYKNAGQQPIQLYKKVEPASVRDGLSAGKWGTICPQKKVLLPSGASFYTLTYKELNEGVPYKVFFDEIGEGESLEAGKPYLFIAEGADILGVEIGNAATSAQDYNGFHGIVGNSDYTLTVSQSESDAYKYYIIYQNQIRRCGVGDFNMAVGRAYIDMSEVSANAAAPAPGRRRVGMTDPEAPQTFTGVDATMNDGKPMKMFIDGQLFILRNGQIFDTTGRIVK